MTQGPATAGKTTRSVSLYDERGFQVLSATEVSTGSGYERIRWSAYIANHFGQVTVTYHSDGTMTESEWGCCGKSYEQDGRGTERYFYYDDLKRLESTLTVGAGTQSDISTTSVYDALGRRLSESTSAGALSQSSGTI